MSCVKCGSLIPESAHKCSTCGSAVDPPNVRAAAKPEEVNALEARYRTAVDGACSKGCADALAKFEAAVKGSCAVIAVDLRFLHFFVTRDKELYSTYQRGVKGQVRKPAAGDDDRHRLSVSGLLFGSYGDDIVYAALSLNGSGLKAYGPYTMVLRDVAIESRSSLLEENSYTFVTRHNLKPGQSIPPGHRAVWNNRHKLAVTKLAARISTTTKASDHPKLLLSDSLTQATDDFIEVHIYGTFDQHAIQSVSGPSKTKNRAEAALLAVAKDHLNKLGKAWAEH